MEPECDAETRYSDYFLVCDEVGGSSSMSLPDVNGDIYFESLLYGEEVVYKEDKSFPYFLIIILISSHLHRLSSKLQSKPSIKTFINKHHEVL